MRESLAPYATARYSHITQAEMREIIKTAVDRLHTFLMMKHCDHTAYEALLTLRERYTTAVGRTGFYQELLTAARTMRSPPEL
jgi:hypothetical protein